MGWVVTPLYFACSDALGLHARNPALEAGSNPQPRSEELLPFTREEVDALALELGPADGSLVLVAAETGLRTNEWIALERRASTRPAERLRFNVVPRTASSPRIRKRRARGGASR